MAHDQTAKKCPVPVNLPQTVDECCPRRCASDGNLAEQAIFALQFGLSDCQLIGWADIISLCHFYCDGCFCWQALSSLPRGCSLQQKNARPNRGWKWTAARSSVLPWSHPFQRRG